MVLLFSSLWAAHLSGMGFDFIVIAPLLPCHCSFFLSLEVGYLFLMGSSILLSMSVQQRVVILVLLQEEMSACPLLCHLELEAPSSFQKSYFSFLPLSLHSLYFHYILFCHSCSMHSLLVPPFRTYFFSLKFFVMIFLIFFFKQLLCLSSPFFSSLYSKKKYVFIFGCAGSSLLCGPFSSCGR